MVHVCTLVHGADAIVSDSKDGRGEGLHQTVMKLEQLPEVGAGGGRDASTRSASRRGGREPPKLSTGSGVHTETTTVEPPDFEKTK